MSIQYNEWETFSSWLLDQAFQASSWVYLALHHCASGVNTVQSLFSTTSRKHFQVGPLDQAFQASSFVYLALHQCASSVNTVQSRFSTTSGKHFQVGCLTKLFKHQASCTLLFTNVLQVLTLCNVDSVQRVGNIFNMVLDQAFQASSLVYLVLHHCASSVNTVQSLSSTTSRKHLQAGCLTKLFKHQAWCTLLFTIVLQVLPLCKVCLVQRVGNIFNMAAWPTFSSIKLRVPCSSPMCFKC